MNLRTSGGGLGGSGAYIADGLRDSGWLWLGETLAISAQARPMLETGRTKSRPCLKKKAEMDQGGGRNPPDATARNHQAGSSGSGGAAKTFGAAEKRTVKRGTSNFEH